MPRPPLSSDREPEQRPSLLRRGGREGSSQCWGTELGRGVVRGEPQAELRAPPHAGIKAEMFSFCSAGPAWGAD